MKLVPLFLATLALGCNTAAFLFTGNNTFQKDWRSNATLELTKPLQFCSTLFGFHLNNYGPHLNCTDVIKRFDEDNDPATLTTDFFNALLSPDKRCISFLAYDNGLPTITIVPINVELHQDSNITRQTIHLPHKRAVSKYGWCYNKDYLWFLQNNNGDEKDHLYIINLSNQKIIDLTPFSNIKAKLIKISPKHPNHIVVGINNNNPQYHDIYKIDITTGETCCLEQGHQFANFIVDSDLNLRFATKFSLASNKQVFFKNDSGSWELLTIIPFEDAFTTQLLHLSSDGSQLYLSDSRNRDCAALVSMDTQSQKFTLLAQDAKADVDKIMYNPHSLKVEAVSFPYLTNHWHFLDNFLYQHYISLQECFGNELYLVSRSLDDELWLVKAVDALGTTSYILYWPNTGQYSTIHMFKQVGMEHNISPTLPIIILNKDGMEMTAYLTLPKKSDPLRSGKPQAPIPLVLLVHGGPWTRDSWEFNPTHQELVQQGYGVLSVNFRGSSGFGKRFLNAGIDQWRDKMHEDLLDAVNWAIENKIADPNKIAIMGGSYGGYAVLTALTKSPKVFACGIDLFGPVNLITLFEEIPAYWHTEIEWMRKMLGGDEQSKLGCQQLAELSPLNYVDQICRPLLIFQGTNDVRVPQLESDQIVKSMHQKNLPFSYVVYQDEGHNFKHEANQQLCFKLIEQFLAQHLQGKKLTIAPEILNRSSAIINCNI